jgi:transposase-like protein
MIFECPLCHKRFRRFISKAPDKTNYDKKNQTYDCTCEKSEKRVLAKRVKKEDL